MLRLLPTIPFALLMFASVAQAAPIQRVIDALSDLGHAVRHPRLAARRRVVHRCLRRAGFADAWASPATSSSSSTDVAFGGTTVSVPNLQAMLELFRASALTLAEEAPLGRAMRDGTRTSHTLGHRGASKLVIDSHADMSHAKLVEDRSVGGFAYCNVPESSTFVVAAFGPVGTHDGVPLIARRVDVRSRVDALANGLPGWTDTVPLQEHGTSTVALWNWQRGRWVVSKTVRTSMIGTVPSGLTLTDKAVDTPEAATIDLPDWPDH